MPHAKRGSRVSVTDADCSGADARLSLTFRRAEPADVEAAVPLILSSGPDAFSYVFDVPGCRSADQFLRQAFVDGRGQFGYRNHWVALHQGQVVGIAAAWGAQQTVAFALRAARQIVHAYGLLQALPVMLRGLRAESVIYPPRRGRLYIAHLGISENCRSQGIGRALIDYLAQHGSQAYQVVALDVAQTNSRALSLYERIGFAVIEERSSTLCNRQGFVPGMRYMERPVPAQQSAGG